jgi:hypothetical protein
MIDWSDFFRIGKLPSAGQMRLFQVIFEIRVFESGRFVFWCDDGAIVERGGYIIHEDRTAHPLRRNEILVCAGDHLRIASWQLEGDWMWGARVASPVIEPEDFLPQFLPAVEGRLRRASGPSLKMITNGAARARAVLSLYSMILNGYAPGKVLLFGEHQWSNEAKSLFSRCLPFAEVIRTSDLLWAIRQSAGVPFANWAPRAWWVMKTCAALLTDPREFCMMDDDVFVLSPVADALDYFGTNDLVYQRDFDHGHTYSKIWGLTSTSNLSTGRFNAGLYWMRNDIEARDIGRRMQRASPQRVWHVAWEQGFIATLFANHKSVELSSQRYFYPLIDGLPGGVLGYDYRNNPCEFTSIHFGGLSEKPGDAEALWLAQDILWARG